MREPGDPVVVIAGPTASGKSALALAVARAFDGHVINADSMQLYRELSILTARPGPDTEALAPHRLYGIRPAAEPASAALWRGWAEAAIAEARARRRPAGGGRGHRALSPGADRGAGAGADIPAVIREEGLAIIERDGPATLHARLAEDDPQGARRAQPGRSGTGPPGLGGIPGDRALDPGLAGGPSRAPAVRPPGSADPAAARRARNSMPPATAVSPR